MPQIFQGKKLDTCILFSMPDACWLKTSEIGMLLIKYIFWGQEIYLLGKKWDACILFSMLAKKIENSHVTYQNTYFWGQKINFTNTTSGLV